MPERVVVEFITHPNIGAVVAGFFTTTERLGQLVEPTREIAQLMMREIEENFRAEGRPSPWAPLADSTVKKRGGRDHPILVDSTDLIEAATAEGNWAITGGGRSAEAHLDSSQIPAYGFIHVTGYSAQSGRFMPARDWTFISDEAMDESEEIIGRFVEEAFEAIPSAV